MEEVARDKEAVKFRLQISDGETIATATVSKYVYNIAQLNTLKVNDVIEISELRVKAEEHGLKRIIMEEGPKVIYSDYHDKIGNPKEYTILK